MENGKDKEFYDPFTLLPAAGAGTTVLLFCLGEGHSALLRLCRGQRGAFLL